MLYKNLDYMLALQETGRLSAAAARLGISQSSLSLFLQRLEDSIGVPLYDRREHQMTKAGDIYCEGARNILYLHEQAMADIQALSDQKTITMGIDVCLSSSFSWLVSDLLEQFSQECPGMFVQIYFLPESELREMIQAGKIDITFCYIQKSYSPTVLQLPCMAEDFILVTPKTQQPPCQDLATALDHLNYIAMFKGSSFRLACDAMLFSRQLTPVVHIESASYDLAASLIETGLYTTIIPARAMDQFRPYDFLSIPHAPLAISGFRILEKNIDLPPVKRLMELFLQFMERTYVDTPHITFLEEQRWF